MTSITLRQVAKHFAAREVIKNIDLNVEDGDFLVLLGPSGCGKSTLLRMLAGLETITSGEIHLGDRRVDQLPPSERDMAFVFQSYALYPHLTVRRNMTFPLLMKRFKWWYHIPVIGGMAKRRIEGTPEIADRVERTARILSLTEMLDRFPRTLSGGQRQRVALGRAMVRQPEVFLMDEPLSNLDAKLRTTMRSEISRLHQEIGGTFVYVTHDQVEAMTMGTKIALMRDGIIQQFGTAREIYTDPANTYVARFIGTPPMNLIEMRVEGDEGVVGSRRLPLAGPLAAAIRSGGPDVLLGVRPNAIAITAPDLEGTIPGTVTMVEHVGAESVIAARLDGARTAHAADGDMDAVMVTVSGYSELALGDKVGLRPDLAQAVAFAPGGERLRP
ncbi:ABC transporter ATP-binding protein [Amaricoccus sp.]|uniref:ABC transporter ATP-binding protein n=1 Tax=Amaricoccus sp. TaxID=1872485 RepID=UPI001B6B5EBF|nr:ABC transporter ATP-binding protein [Amaricoccus sp.]MBP7002690.1 ABC transporter ATP-binding protein [Amaricoccus sp.]